MPSSTPKLPHRTLVIIALISAAVGIILTFSGPQRSSPSRSARAEKTSHPDEVEPASLSLENETAGATNALGDRFVRAELALGGGAGVSTTGRENLSVEGEKSGTGKMKGGIAGTAELPRSAVEPTTGGDAWTYPETLRNLAVTNYLRAMQKLALADSELDRYLVLGDTAKGALNFGKIEDARKYAIELLALDEKLKERPWRNGNAVHDANLVLGRIALLEGDLEAAKQHLVQAGKTSGSPNLNSFGPNMSLANDLLQRGERDAVLEYFEQCRRFWKPAVLDRWTEEVKAGRVPNFRANLFY